MIDFYHCCAEGLNKQIQQQVRQIQQYVNKFNNTNDKIQQYV